MERFAAKVRALKQSGQALLTFGIDSDYFWLVDKIHLFFELSVPSSTNLKVRSTWLILKLLSLLQYFYLLFNLFHTMVRSTSNVDQFMASFNMCITLTASLARASCLALHRDTILSLKQFANQKGCQREDDWAFELRKKAYRRNVKFFAVFQTYTVCNAAVWCFTEFRTEEVFQIPFLPESTPNGLKHFVNVFDSIIGIGWGVACFQSFTQFATILNSLLAELTIVVNQFERLFCLCVSKYAFDSMELVNLSSQKRELFWEDLDVNFKKAIGHHAVFVRHFQQLKSASNVNFFILLSSATVMITSNVYLMLIQPSARRIPLLIVGVQFLLEVLVCCSMFQNLQQENDKIARIVYGIDWLSVAGRTGQSQRAHHKSIGQNVLLVLRQVHGGMRVKAGGMYELNRETALNLIRLVYSMLTFLLKAK